jgi:hypothetical protein
VNKICDDFFAKADQEGDGQVTYEEYKKWVADHPSVLTFFRCASRAHHPASE